MTSNSPSQDERLMAALAHGSVVITGPGIVVGVLIWLTQKDKAPYAAAQAVQAAVYQLIGFVVMVAAWIAWTGLLMLSMIPAMVDPAAFDANPPAFFWITMFLMVVPFAIMIVWWLYGLWAALRCWQGQDFRYLLIGRALEGR